MPIPRQSTTRPRIPPLPVGECGIDGSRTLARYRLWKIAPGFGVGHAMVGVIAGRKVGYGVRVAVEVTVHVGECVDVGIGVNVDVGVGVGVSLARVGDGVNRGWMPVGKGVGTTTGGCGTGGT